MVSWFIPDYRTPAIQLNHSSSRTRFTCALSLSSLIRMWSEKSTLSGMISLPDELLTVPWDTGATGVNELMLNRQEERSSQGTGSKIVRHPKAGGTHKTIDVRRTCFLCTHGANRSGLAHTVCAQSAEPTGSSTQGVATHNDLFFLWDIPNLFETKHPSLCKKNFGQRKQTLV